MAHKKLNGDAALTDTVAAELLTGAFVHFQSVSQEFYKKNVLDPALKQKEAFEKKTGVDMPFAQPQEGAWW